MSKLFTCGTCRMTEPTKILIGRGVDARNARHRLHSPNQVLQFFKSVAGGEAVFTGKNVYLLSDAAFEDIVVKGLPAAATLDYLGGLERHLRKSNRVIIEISTRRETWVDTPGGPFYLNHFNLRDIGLHGGQYAALAAAGGISALDQGSVKQGTLTQREVFAAMRQIKSLLRGRSILWAAHACPAGDAPEFEHVKSVRSSLAAMLAASAQALGDEFFDPSGLVAELGDQAAWGNGGQDLYHYTDAMLEALADVYALPAAPPPPPTPAPPPPPPPALFACGTCRIAEPISVLAGRGVDAVNARYRLHTPHQILQFFKFIAGKEKVFNDKNVYLLSDMTFGDIVVKGIAADATLEHLDRLARHLRKSSRVLIEISSRWEVWTDTPGGPFYLNHSNLREMELHHGQYAALALSGGIAALDKDSLKQGTLSRQEVLDAMRQIKSLLGGCSVLWISHACPAGDAPEFEHVKSVRSSLAEVVAAAAQALGDEFFDPSVLVARLGDKAAWQEDGRDLYHYTEAMVEALADAYAPPSRPALEGAAPGVSTQPGDPA